MAPEEEELSDKFTEKRIGEVLFTFLGKHWYRPSVNTGNTAFQVNKGYHLWRHVVSGEGGASRNQGPDSSSFATVLYYCYVSLETLLY